MANGQNIDYSEEKKNGARASSAPALGLNTIIFKYVYWYMKQISGERLHDHWSSCFSAGSNFLSLDGSQLVLSFAWRHKQLIYFLLAPQGADLDAFVLSFATEICIKYLGFKYLFGKTKLS